MTDGISLVAPGTEAMVIGCESCGSALQLAAGERTAICPYCASTSVVERPPAPDRPAPLFTIGFVIPREDALGRVKKWISNRGFFTHSGLKKAPIENTRGVYLPAYLYGAIARSEYSAEIGENYTVTETYTTISNGKRVVRTRTRVETEWRKLRGRHACYVRDVVVTASRGIPNEELDAVEPFDLRAIKRYSSAMISGWLAEEASLAREQCFQHARGEAMREIGRVLAQFMPGDKHRNLDGRTDLSDEVLDLFLLPIWVFAVRYDPEKPPLRILVNGQTGKVSGKVPLSTIKIVLAVLLGLGLVGLVVLLIAMAGDV